MLKNFGIYSILFTLYKEFASPIEVEKMKEQFLSGIGWGEAKNELFNVMNDFLEHPREKYNALMASPETLDKILENGAEKARAVSVPFLKEVKRKIGFSV